MQATITKDLGYFPAGHTLYNHDGLCRDPHGHNYGVVVEAHGVVNHGHGQPDEGMVVDFGRISAAWGKIKPLLDHKDLNVVLVDGGIAADAYGPIVGPTTAENIAGWLLRAFVLEGVPATAVKVYETTTSCAEVRVEWLDDAHDLDRRVIRARTTTHTVA
jgi:6-pyruvoyl-tetrahydropterin synthase